MIVEPNKHTKLDLGMVPQACDDRAALQSGVMHELCRTVELRSPRAMVGLVARINRTPKTGQLGVPDGRAHNES